MAKSRKEMMQLLAKLSPIMPRFSAVGPTRLKGICDVSEQELDILITEFQCDRAAEAVETDATPPRPLSIEPGGPATDHGGLAAEPITSTKSLERAAIQISEPEEAVG